MTEEKKMVIKAVEKFHEGKKKVVWKDSPENKNLDAWIKAGEPVVLYEMDKIEDVHLYGDCGHGHIYIIREGKVLDGARDFVSTDINQHTYIGLSEAYSIRLSGLYRREIKC